MTSITFDMFIRADWASLPILYSSTTWLLSSFMRFSPSPTVREHPVVPSRVSSSASSWLCCCPTKQLTNWCSGAIRGVQGQGSERLHLDGHCSEHIVLFSVTSPLSTTPSPRAFVPFHSWKNPDRKRRSRCASPSARRTSFGNCWAVAAGRQTRRTAHAPLLQWEYEPGESIAFLSVANHPFTEEAPFPDDLAP